MLVQYLGQNKRKDQSLQSNHLLHNMDLFHNMHLLLLLPLFLPSKMMQNQHSKLILSIPDIKLHFVVQRLSHTSNNFRCTQLVHCSKFVDCICLQKNNAGDKKIDIFVLSTKAKRENTKYDNVILFGISVYLPQCGIGSLDILR